VRARATVQAGAGEQWVGFGKKAPGKFWGCLRKPGARNPNREKGYRSNIGAVCAKLNTFIDIPLANQSRDMSTGHQMKDRLPALREL
jgi:hypothetical protein